MTDITNYETYNSQLVSIDRVGKTVTRIYDVGAMDQEVAVASLGFSVGDYLEGSNPSIYVQRINSERSHPNRTLVTIEFGPYKYSAEENKYGEKWEWDIVASEVHIDSVSGQPGETTPGLLQLSYYPVSDPVPYVMESYGETAIGREGDDIKGVDVFRPKMSMTVTVHVTDTALADTRQLIQLMMNKINGGAYDAEQAGAAAAEAWYGGNPGDDVGAAKAYRDAYIGTGVNAAWFGYLPGEVLYIGAVIRKVSSNDWLVEHKFLIAHQQAPFRTTFYNGTSVTLTCYAWDIITFEHVVEATSGVNMSKIQAAHLARVYNLADFDNFGFHGPVDD